MKSESAIWSAFERARRELAGNPSVRSVELGWKVSQGEVQPELAVRVYVDRKRPLAEVPAGQRIPPRVAGLPTDILTVREERLLGHDMTGGDKITRIVWNEHGTGSGTLGCIATRLADSRPMMLSNQHVFRNDLGSPERRRELYQPDISCKALGSNCNYVGYVVDGLIGNFAWSPDATEPKEYFLDCAVGEIDDEDFRRGVKGLPAIAGSQDITALATGPGNTPLAVKKMGARTDLTTGIVISVNSTGHEKVGPFEIQDQPLTILIRTTSGKQLSEEFEVPAAEKQSIVDTFNDFGGPGTVTQLAGNRLRFDVPRFSDQGDSGSVVVTDAGRIVGLLYASAVFIFPTVDGAGIVPRTVPIGESRACHIGPAMARLGIRIDASTAPSAGRDSIEVRAVTQREPLLADRLALLEEQLRATRAGEALRTLIRAHGPEMVELVHHRRRVLVCWHRHQGPAFTALVADALRDPERAMPNEHSGVALTTLLSAMCDALMAEGGAALRAALAANRPWVLEWIRSSDRVPGLLSALARHDPGPLKEAAYA